MTKHREATWLSSPFTKAAQLGFRKAYSQIRIDERKYLRHLQRVHKLPVQSWSDMFLLGPQALNPIAERTIKSAARTAGFEGMGLGFGGFLTVVPDMGILSAITLRMLQRLSLLYGFEYSTEDETVSLWMAAASAAGLDLGRDFIEKQAVERVVPRIIDRIAVRVGAEVAEKWAGRIVPVLSAGAAGAINYYFVRAWGRRAQKHFLERHHAVIDRMETVPSVRARQVALLPSATTS
jgi:EcsC protein family